MEITEISTDAIILDKRTQPRATVDEFIVNEYRVDMMNGDEFPPVMVFAENGNYYLADGWHRLLAAQQLGRKTIACAIKPGTIREAILYSCSANADHGKRRTPGDVSRAINKLLNDPEWTMLSDGEIAKTCRATRSYVSQLRRSLGTVPSEKTYTTKHGTTAVMDTSNIGGNGNKPTTEPQAPPDLFIRRPPTETSTAQHTPPKYDPLNYRIFAAPIFELSSHIEPNSIDAIITDPPYPKEYIPRYAELAEQAAIVLKPGGILVAMAGHNYIGALIQQMSNYLKYHWMGCYYMPTGQHASLPVYSVSVYWKPLLIFCKGSWPKTKVFKDVVINDEADKNYHEWGQGVTGFRRIIEAFTLPNETVLDPFVGGGTTAIAALDCGRYFIGSDISAEEVAKTLARLE